MKKKIQSKSKVLMQFFHPLFLLIINECLNPISLFLFFFLFVRVKNVQNINLKSKIRLNSIKIRFNFVSKVSFSE